MRFLIAGGAPHAGPPGSWGGHTWHPAWHLRGYFNAGRGAGEAEVDMRRVDALVDEVASYDGVFCESTMALILAQEWRARGLPPRVILSLQVHSLEPLQAVRGWYRRVRGTDPWTAMTEAPWISWLAPTLRQRGPLLEAGFVAESLHQLRISASMISLLLPDVEAHFAGNVPTSSAISGLPRDAVVFAGNGRRDWAAIMRTAIELAELPCLIVGCDRHFLEHQLTLMDQRWPANLSHVESVPIAEFIAVVRSARVVAVPLLEGEGDGGHTTVAISHRVGVPVVCSEAPTMVDYYEPGVTCLTARPGDSAGVAAAIRRVCSDEALRERLRREGARFERQLDALFHDDLRAAVDRARGHLPA